MRRLILGMTVLGALVCAFPAAEAQQAKPAKQPAKGKDLDASQLPPGTFTGKLVSVPDSDRMFTVAVTYQQVQPNPNFRGDGGIGSAYRNILNLQTQMARSRNPGAYVGRLQMAILQLQQRIAQAQTNAVKLVNATQNVDFQAEENVKVRTKMLPAAFDDKGNIKKYTQAELRDLKGKDSHLPGYESSIDNLKPGQTVQVILKRHRAPVPSPLSPSKKDLDKDLEKEPAKEAAVEKKMQVQVIIITDDDGSGDGTPTKSKKGNN